MNKAAMTYLARLALEAAQFKVGQAALCLQLSAWLVVTIDSRMLI